MIQYQIVGESGPDHNKVFDAVVKLNDEIIGEGTGHTKKQAEQQAAIEAISKINN